MPDAVVFLLLLAVVLLVAWCWAPKAVREGDEPIVWPESPDYHGDAEFFARRRRLRERQQAARAAGRFGTWWM